MSPPGPRRCPTTGLTQRDPDEGALPTEQTEIRVLLGGDALYVGARLSDHDPSQIRALLTRRDATSESDRFTVELDSRVRPAHRVRLRGQPARRAP